jgi:hypothetical protein
MTGFVLGDLNIESLSHCFSLSPCQSVFADASQKHYMPMVVSEWYQCFFLGQILSFFAQIFWETHGFYFSSENCFLLFYFFDQKTTQFLILRNERNTMLQPWYISIFTALQVLVLGDELA